MATTTGGLAFRFAFAPQLRILGIAHHPIVIGHDYLAVALRHAYGSDNPGQLSFQGDWRFADVVSAATIEILETSPARVVINTIADYLPQGSGIEVTSRYAIYPTGRIGINCILRNTHAQSQVIDGVDYLHTDVAHTLSWSVSDLSGDKAVSYTRSGGATPLPSLLVINPNAGGVLAADSLTSRYWDAGSLNLAPDVDFTRTGVLAVAPGGQQLAILQDRADDQLLPQLIGLTGATAVGDGYLEEEAAYVLDATAGNVKFGVGDSNTRHSPAFVIQSWSAETWSISLNGETIVNSTAPIGKRGIASHDKAAQQLVFVFAESIPTEVATAARTFALKDSL